MAAHGVELVAIEWLQGNGRGILRLYIDAPGGDPRVKPDLSRPQGATADVCVAVSHEVSAYLDKDEDRIAIAYDLEVSSPGFERPVQQRGDFERFAGLVIGVKTRAAHAGKMSFLGTLEGTDDTAEPFAVKVRVKTGAGEEVVSIPYALISRARLAEIKAPTPKKPGKGPSKKASKPEASAKPDGDADDALADADEGVGPAIQRQSEGH